MTDEHSFGAWLREQRAARDLTPSDLARRAGCTIRTLARLEASQARPAPDLAIRLAAALDVPAPDLAALLAPASVTPSRPTGTVTFLFTDIEGSTRHWEQHPNLMPAAFGRQETLIRQAIAIHGGYTYKMIGDAFQSAFQTAPAALAAALAAQRALAAESWGPLGPLRVRMVLHTGAVEERGDDYVGPLLNRVARLLGAAHGGQILLTAVTQQQIGDRLPPGVTLRDLGEHRLRDLIRPEHVFQACAADLPADFPPLKTVDAGRHNLLAPPTPLIGRAQELAALHALLGRPDVRLLTVTGPGGIGKTRLSLQLCAALADTFADGVWFVTLAPISDPKLVAASIAQVLGVKETADQPLVEGLQAYLREKRLLLLLDNFEQVVAAAGLVGKLLAGAPGLKVLVTSRTVLHLYGEHEFVVPPLGLPPQHALAREASGLGAEGKTLAEYEAVRLFCARAQAVNAAFAITDANVRQVVAICARLDGLPLAIELAAARTKLFTPRVLLERLLGADRGSPLQLLTGGPRDLPARHQTLRNAIAWSYELLSAEEQSLFRRLAVFVGGFSNEAAAVVCGAARGLGEDVLDGLAALIDQSLLQQQVGPEGAPGFAMLATIRAYALEQLEASGEANDMRVRHATYYAALVEKVAPRLRSGEQQAWLARMDAEYENIRAALTWALDDAEDEWAALGAGLTGRLWYYWVLRQHFHEARRWLEHPATRRIEVPVAARAQVLIGAAFLARRIGQVDRALTLAAEGLLLAREANVSFLIALAIAVPMAYPLEVDQIRALWAEALEHARRNGDPWLLALVLHRAVPALAGQVGNTTLEMAMYAEGLEQARASGDPWLLADMFSDEGWAARRRGDLDAARVFLAESAALQRQLHDPLGVAIALLGLALVAEDQADYATARRQLEERLKIERGLENTLGITGSLHDLSRLALLQAEYARAEGYIDDMFKQARSADNMLGLALAQWQRVALLFERGSYQEAEEQGQALLDLVREKQFVLLQVDALSALGRHALARGDLALAEARAAEGLALARDKQDVMNITLCLDTLGHSAMRLGDLPTARAHLEESLTIARRSGNSEHLAEALGSLGMLLLAAGESSRAAEVLAEAFSVYRRMGAPVRVARLLEQIAGVAADGGQAACAVRLWGAADELRRTIDAPIWLSDRPGYERRILAARAASGEAAFEAAWKRGQALSWELVVEEALAVCRVRD